jgi:hypothetical protein
MVHGLHNQRVASRPVVAPAGDQPVSAASRLRSLDQHEPEFNGARRRVESERPRLLLPGPPTSWPGGLSEQRKAASGIRSNCAGLR